MSATTTDGSARAATHLLATQIRDAADVADVAEGQSGPRVGLQLGLADLP